MASDNEANGTCGFVYVATGKLYFDEAAAAARQLRATNPTARICLVADAVHGEKFWDDLVLIDRPFLDFRDKLNLTLCPYDRFVFLDTDTYVAGDLGELFELLTRFDMIGHQLFEGHDYRCPGVPDAFPEFNAGVIGFRRSPAVEALWRRWREIFFAYREELATGEWNYANASDQKGLRIAVYESGVRHAVLGPEYDFIVQHVQFACAAVKLLHGRPMAELARIERIVNAELGLRTWVPILDACVAQRMTGGAWARLAWRAGLQWLRAAGRRLVPSGLRGRLRGSPAVRRAFFRNEEIPSTAVEHRRKWGK